MSEQILRTYQSRRNSVSLVQTEGERFVRKTFSEEEALQKELQMYHLLQDKNLPCAKVLGSDKKTLLLSELPGRNLVECLEEQEQTGVPVWEIWEKLAAWLIAFHRYTGFVMTDVNLRNFLYDEGTKTLYGLDFEECAESSPELPAAAVAAFIRTYKPEHTPLKQEIAGFVLNLFAEYCEKKVDQLLLLSVEQERRIITRRKNRI